MVKKMKSAEKYEKFKVRLWCENVTQWFQEAIYIYVDPLLGNGPQTSTGKW
jgi:hypothetical protein